MARAIAEFTACLVITIAPSGVLLQPAQWLAGSILTGKLKPTKPETFQTP